MFVFSSQTQSHGGQVVNEFTGYALAHKGKATAADNVYDPADGPDAYTNASVYPKLAEYTSAARQRHGETFDPATDPLDTNLLMRLGGGKQHGRYWMANSAIESSSVPTLSQIRRDGTRSSSDIPIAPRQPSNAQMFSAFQVSAVSFVVHSFHTCTLLSHTINFAGVILQAQIAQLQTNQENMAVAHQRQLAAVTQHYQRQMQDFAAYFRGLQIPGMQQHELPASIFAPPPFPVPTPIATPVSILPVALACAAILQVLMRSLILCAGTVGGFEPDSSRC